MENTCFCGFLGDCASSNGSKHSNEELSSVPQCKKPAICLMEKIPVIDKLGSGMSYSAAGHEFNINNQQYVSNRMS